jgi:hypothetical protein
MKLIALLLYVLLLAQPAKASLQRADTIPPATKELLTALELSSDQKTAIVELLADYKLQQAKQKKYCAEKYLPSCL